MSERAPREARTYTPSEVSAIVSKRLRTAKAEAALNSDVLLPLLADLTARVADLERRLDAVEHAHTVG